MRAVYLVLQVVPPIGPRLFDTPFFLDDGTTDDSSKHGKRHGNTVVIIAMNGSAVFETGERSPINDDPVQKLARFDPKLGCMGVSR